MNLFSCTFDPLCPSSVDWFGESRRQWNGPFYFVVTFFSPSEFNTSVSSETLSKNTENQKEAEEEYFLLLEHSYEVGDTTANLGSPDRKK